MSEDDLAMIEWLRDAPFEQILAEMKAVEKEILREEFRDVSKENEG